MNSHKSVEDAVNKAIRDAHEEAIGILRWLAEFRSEGRDWRSEFERWDRGGDGEPFGMYTPASDGEPGDEDAPFFSEAFLYNLLGKDDARSILSSLERLVEVLGVEGRIF